MSLLMSLLLWTLAIGWTRAQEPSSFACTLVEGGPRTVGQTAIRGNKVPLPYLQRRTENIVFLVCLYWNTLMSYRSREINLRNVLLMTTLHTDAAVSSGRIRSPILIKPWYLLLWKGYLHANQLNWIGSFWSETSSTSMLIWLENKGYKKRCLAGLLTYKNNVEYPKKRHRLGWINISFTNSADAVSLVLLVICICFQG